MRWLQSLLWVTLAGWQAALAQPSVPAMTSHRMWSAVEGAPGEVSGLAQTQDGLLWVSSSSGLYTYDGTVFKRWVSPTAPAEAIGNVSALWADPEGGLWVGHRFGRVVRIHGGQVHVYEQPQGLPTMATVVAFGRDASGRVWVSTYAGLFWLDGGRWRPPLSEWGLPQESSSGLLLGHDGAFWISTQTALWRRSAHEQSFQRLERLDGLAYLASAPDGRVWVNNGRFGVWTAGEPSLAPAATIKGVGIDAAEMVFDRSGALWLHVNEGVVRIPAPYLMAPGALDLPTLLSRAEVPWRPLVGQYVGAMLADSEDSVWIGTNRGLARFREPAFKSWLLDERSKWPSIAQDPKGGVWVGDAEGRLRHSERHLVTPLVHEGGITALSTGCSDRVWSASSTGLIAWGTAGRLARLSLPLPNSNVVVQALMCLEDGSLLMSGRLAGLWLHRGGAWTMLSEKPVPPNLTWYPLVMARAEADRVWLGDAQGALWRLENGRLTKVLEPAQINIGAVQSLYMQGARLWLGGERGLALYEAGLARPVSVQRGVLTGVSGIAADEDGAIWVHAATGVVRITSQQQGALEDPLRRPLQVRWFGVADGLSGQPQQLRPLPAALRAQDGRIWLSTSDKVLYVDPASLPALRNDVKVHVAEVAWTDTRMSPPGGRVQLPIGHRDFRIGLRPDTLSDAASLRYELQRPDVDEGWTDLGAAPVIHMGPLGPGRHELRFRVVNGEGAPSTEITTLSVEVPAYWHEQAWVRALLAASGMALLLALQMTWQRRRRDLELLRLRVGMQERERIARDLHDTLLQSVQGLVLVFHSVVQRLAPDDEQRPRLQQTFERAEQLLEEGRDRILGLRQEPSLGLMYAELTALGHALSAQMGGEFRVRSQGDLEAVTASPGSLDQLRLIVREALMNAFRHACAAEIRLELVVHSDDLRLTVSDNGISIPFGMLDGPESGRRMGLRSMRERAAWCGAQLRVESFPGNGTDITIRLPVFAKTAVRSLRWRLRLQKVLHEIRSAWR